MHTILSQIITLLHVSTLSCNPQTTCNQYLAKLHQYFVLSTNKFTQQFHKLSHCYMFRHYRVILRQPVINTLPSYTSILCHEPTNAHNNFTNYHTATCFDTIVPSPDSLLSIPCPVTPVHTGQHDSTINIQTVYTATTTDWLHENCSNIMVLANFIVNWTVLMF